MTDTHDTLIRKLDALLDIERQALLSGDLSALEDIVDDKENLIDALNAAEFAEPEPIADVSEKVKRNQVLLEEALQGIRSVAKKLAELRRARREFDTYNQLGQKRRIEGDAETSVEKRA